MEKGLSIVCLNCGTRNFLTALLEFKDHEHIFFCNQCREVILGVTVRVSIKEPKKCLHCGKYFIPRKRSDEKYCNRSTSDGSKTCKDIGPLKLYQDKVKNDVVLRGYKKAYKTLHSRMRKGKLNPLEFFVWDRTCREIMNNVKDGTKSIMEFEQWLKEFMTSKGVQQEG